MRKGLNTNQIQQDLLQLGSTLIQLEKQTGKQSGVYQEALGKFSRLWFTLRMTHPQTDFLKEVTRPA